MSRAVRFDDYGGVEVLEVRDVARPEPGPDQVLVAVRAERARARSRSKGTFTSRRTPE